MLFHVTMLAGFTPTEKLALLAAVGGALLVVWIWMVVDCERRETDPDGQRRWRRRMTTWGGVGALWYFFARKLPRGHVSVASRLEPTQLG